MKISLPSVSYDLQAPQDFTYSKIDTDGIIPLKRVSSLHKMKIIYTTDKSAYLARTSELN